MRRSAAQRAFELLLAHLRAAADVAPSRLAIKLGPSLLGSACARPRSTPPRRCPRRARLCRFALRRRPPRSCSPCGGPTASDPTLRRCPACSRFPCAARFTLRRLARRRLSRTRRFALCRRTLGRGRAAGRRFAGGGFPPRGSPPAGAPGGSGFARRAQPSLGRRLAGLAATFLGFRAAQIPPALFRRIVFRRAGFAEGNRDRLLAAFHLSAAAAFAALRFAALVAMHLALHLLARTARVSASALLSHGSLLSEQHPR